LLLSETLVFGSQRKGGIAKNLKWSERAGCFYNGTKVGFPRSPVYLWRQFKLDANSQNLFRISQAGLTRFAWR